MDAFETGVFGRTFSGHEPAAAATINFPLSDPWLRRPAHDQAAIDCAIEQLAAG